jgi:uncharacterized protein (TIGR03663 family)
MRFDGSRLRDDRALQVVLAVTLLGLVARFVLLGSRVAHYDEGRVAYWTLHYLRSGEFHYRFIIHGPFVQHLERVVFWLIGPSDFAARLPVAVVSGLLPLTALFFRERLRDIEVAAMGLFFAFNAVILYYSRFMRSTVLVAAFCFLAFALFLRAYDGHGVRNFYLGMAVLALGFAAKENAAVYLLTWLGAAVLVADDSLFRQDGASAFARARARLSFLDRDYVSAAAVHGVLGLGVFLLITLLFYAPRDPNGVGLWSSVVDPTQIPALLNRTIDDVWTGYSYWFGGPGDTTMAKYLERLGRFLATSATYAGPLLALSVAGFLAERFLAARPRPLVMFASYWGYASVLGYPLATDIWGAWIIVNALVPLVIPAAVGLGLIVRVGEEALADDDRVSVAAVGVLLFVVVGQMAFVGATGVYANPTGADNQLVQYAQPSQESRTAMEDIERVVPSNDGTDVLVYDPGEKYLLRGGQIEGPKFPKCLGTAGWYRSLPLSWYYNVYDAEVSCVEEPGGLPAGEDLPPVVVVEGDCQEERTMACRGRPESISAPGDLDQRVPEQYERHAYFHRTSDRPTVVYVDATA